MRIAVVYNEPEQPAREGHWLSRSNAGLSLPASFVDRAELGVLAQTADIVRVLQELGEVPILHAAVSGSGLADFLDRERPDVVVNCCESLRGDPALEMSVAALFELFRVPFTGSSALTLGIALDKGLAKALFRASGVPSPPHVVVRNAADLERAGTLTYPLIIKPVAQDASIGIDGNAVVHDPGALARRVNFVWAQFGQAALAEEFIEGRELNVALLAGPDGELGPLPISEVSFEALPSGMPPIVGYDAKWTTDSAAYLGTPVHCPAAVDEKLADRVRSHALAAARAVGLRDYGRVDLRVRAGDGAVYVLEVNPNPDLSADAGFMRAARADGQTFASTIHRILACALKRVPPPVVTTGVSWPR